MMTDQAYTDPATASESTEKQLRDVIEKQLKHQNAKNMRGILQVMHEDSPWRESTKSFLEPFFDQFTLQNTLLSYSYVGHDADYAYCRIRQKVEKVAGPDFQDIVSENLVACKRQDEDWKIWNQMVLSVALP